MREIINIKRRLSFQMVLNKISIFKTRVDACFDQIESTQLQQKERIRFIELRLAELWRGAQMS